LAIAEAQEAANTEQWTPAVSQRFWTAFAKLCDLILPVTMDCLKTNSPNIQVRMWWFGQKINKSMAERSSRRYLVALVCLLFLILPIQLYVWTSNKLSDRTNELIRIDTPLVVDLSQGTSAVTTLIANLSSKGGTPTDAEKIGVQVKYKQLETQAAELDLETEKLLFQAGLLSSISTFGISNRPNIGTTSTESVSSDEKINDSAVGFKKAQVEAINIQERAALFVGIFSSFILPVLFGTMGAVAYVLRTISDQIRTTTFSSNSPIRHVMRVALGALSGLVVGLFTGLTTQLSLPPWQWHFSRAMAWRLYSPRLTALLIGSGNRRHLQLSSQRPRPVRALSLGYGAATM
jgi:hypothetical protein